MTDVLPLTQKHLTDLRAKCEAVQGQNSAAPLHFVAAAAVVLALLDEIKRLKQAELDAPRGSFCGTCWEGDNYSRHCASCARPL